MSKRQRVLPVSVRNLLALNSFGCFWVSAHRREGDWIGVFRLSRGQAHDIGDFRIDGKTEEDLVKEIQSFLNWINGIS